CGRLRTTTWRHSQQTERCPSTSARSALESVCSAKAVRRSASGWVCCPFWTAPSLCRSELESSAMTNRIPYSVGTRAGGFLAAFYSHLSVNNAHPLPEPLRPVPDSCPSIPSPPLPAFSTL